MNIKVKMITLAVLVVAMSAPSFAAEDTQTAVSQKIGVVDVKKVVNESKEVEKVKKEQQANKKVLVDFIKAQAEIINKEPDAAKKEELKKKFTADLTAKKDVMDKSYGEKLMKINNDMNAQLTKLAKDKNYDLILTQDSVLYGGENLTKDLMKLVK